MGCSLLFMLLNERFKYELPEDYLKELSETMNEDDVLDLVADCTGWASPGFLRTLSRLAHAHGLVARLISSLYSLPFPLAASVAFCMGKKRRCSFFSSTLRLQFVKRDPVLKRAVALFLKERF